MKQGLKNLKKALNEGVKLEVIVEAFFGHDKGYLNASEELPLGRFNYYQKRLDEIANENAKAS